MGTLNVSFEFFTPKDETAAPGFWQAVERLDALAPGFFSLTCGAGATTSVRSTSTPSSSSNLPICTCFLTGVSWPTSRAMFIDALK